MDVIAGVMAPWVRMGRKFLALRDRMVFRNPLWILIFKREYMVRMVELKPT